VQKPKPTTNDTGEIHEELLYISIWFTHETYRSGTIIDPVVVKRIYG
jgi:hypothetical protein